MAEHDPGPRDGCRLAPPQAPPGTTCPAEEQLALAAEQGLDKLGPALQAHLADCPCCRAVLQDVMLDRLPGEPPPIRAIDPEPIWSRWLIPLPVGRPAALAASLGVLLLAVTVTAAPFVWRAGLFERQPAPQSERPEQVAAPGPGASAVLPQLQEPALPQRPEQAQPATSVASSTGPSLDVALAPNEPLSAGEHAPAAAPPAPHQAGTVLDGQPPATPGLIGGRTADAPESSAPHTGSSKAAAQPAPAAPRAVAPGKDPAATSPAGRSAGTGGSSGRRSQAEQLFVEGMVHFQEHRFDSAIDTFDRLLKISSDPDLERVARRWRAKSVAERRGDCQPGYVRRVRLEQPAPDPDGTPGRQGPTEHIDCVLP